MTKIMLVEDDKSLREIYGVRLLAEGYDIVSAGDGEEALAVAIKERPQLIISDVMMPKVSGYDMLDILRSTTETKNIRVIMMTALSSEEQRQRAESLGADRYLVKSQVGIEDVVRVVHEVLEDTPEALASTHQQPQAPVATVAPPQSTPAPQAVPAPTPAPILPPIQTTLSPAPQPTPAPSTVFANLPTPSPIPAKPVRAFGTAPKPASLKNRVIQPIDDPSVSRVDINDLLDRELAKEAGLTADEIPVVRSIEQERASVEEQLKSFVPPEPTPVEAPPVDISATPASASLLPTPGVGTFENSAPPVAPTIPTPTAPAMPPAPQLTSQPAQYPSTPPPAPQPPLQSSPTPQTPQPQPVSTPTPLPQTPPITTPVTQPAPVTPISTATPSQQTAQTPFQSPTQQTAPPIDLTKLPEVPPLL